MQHRLAAAVEHGMNSDNHVDSQMPSRDVDTAEFRIVATSFRHVKRCLKSSIARRHRPNADTTHGRAMSTNIHKEREPPTRMNCPRPPHPGPSSAEQTRHDKVGVKDYLQAFEKRWPGVEPTPETLVGSVQRLENWYHQVNHDKLQHVDTFRL